MLSRVAFMSNFGINFCKAEHILKQQLHFNTPHDYFSQPVHKVRLCMII